MSLFIRGIISILVIDRPTISFMELVTKENYAMTIMGFSVVIFLLLSLWLAISSSTSTYVSPKVVDLIEKPVNILCTLCIVA